MTPVRLAPSDPELRRALEARARELGLGMVGVTTPEPSGHIPYYRDWLAQGAHGGMRYLAGDEAIERRADLGRTMEGVRSVIVVADDYAPAGEGGPPGFGRESPGLDGYSTKDDPSRGTIARYARGRDYHKVLKKKLLGLLEWLDGRVEGGARGRAYVDTGPLLERELGQRAGLGWFGRNTMLIHPRRGSYFFLGVLLVDATLPADPPFELDRCGSCRACLDACPTGALLGRDEDGAPRIDARLCISYLTIEQRGPIPEELRPAIGNRIYGCDICQEVCPWNSPKLVSISAERDYRPDWREAEDRPDVAEDLPVTESPSLVELMRMTREEWDRWTRGSAIRRAGYAGFRRNVAVAMGNWLASTDESPEEAVAVLRDARDDESELVREHAAWALGRARC